MNGTCLPALVAPSTCNLEVPPSRFRRPSPLEPPTPRALPSASSACSAGSAASAQLPHLPLQPPQAMSSPSATWPAACTCSATVAWLRQLTWDRHSDSQRVQVRIPCRIPGDDSDEARYWVEGGGGIKSQCEEATDRPKRSPDWVETQPQLGEKTDKKRSPDWVETRRDPVTDPCRQPPEARSLYAR